MFYYDRIVALGLPADEVTPWMGGELCVRYGGGGWVWRREYGSVTWYPHGRTVVAYDGDYDDNTALQRAVRDFRRLTTVRWRMCRNIFGVFDVTYLLPYEGIYELFSQEFGIHYLGPPEGFTAYVTDVVTTLSSIPNNGPIVADALEELGFGRAEIEQHMLWELRHTDVVTHRATRVINSWCRVIHAAKKEAAHGRD